MTDIEQLIENLNSSDPLVRLNACQQLKLEPELTNDALETLRMTTKDHDPRIADTATNILINHISGSQTSRRYEMTPPAGDPNPSNIGPTYGFSPPGDEPPFEITLPEQMPDDLPGARPKHPWFKIWIKPRETIREIINYDPAYLVFPLALITGLGFSLNRVMVRNLGDRYSLTVVTLIVIIAGPIGGLISVYAGGAILSWVGKKLGGKGNHEEVQSAVAWSSITGIIFLILGLVQIAMFGGEPFSSSTPRLDALIDANPVSFVLTGLYLFGLETISAVIALWRMVLVVKCVAEAHQFSSWRSIATLAIPLFVILLIGLICVVPILI